jgi:hypothetical protein
MYAPKRMAQRVSRDSCLHTLCMPPKHLLCETVVIVIFDANPAQAGYLHSSGSLIFSV